MAIPVGDRSVASARLRLYSLLEALPPGYSCEIVSAEHAERAVAECDVLYVQKAAWPAVVGACRRARALGKRVVYDIDDDFGVWPGMDEAAVCALATAVTVDSVRRAAWLRGLVGTPVHVVPCMIDLARDPARRAPRVREQAASACAFGNHGSIEHAAPWLGALAARSVDTYAIGPASAAESVPGSRFVEFRLERFVADLLEADVAVLRHPADAFGDRKDNNRLIMAMSLGLPALCSATDAFAQTLNDAGLSQLACDGLDDVAGAFELLRPRERRAEIAARSYAYAWENYRPERVAASFARVLEGAAADVA